MNPIQVSWLNPEQTIFLYEFPVQWDWDDYVQAHAVSNQLLAEATHQDPVGIVFTMPPTGRLPPNTLSEMRNVVAHRNPRVTALVMVSNAAFLKTMWRSVMSLFVRKNALFQMADTIEQAQAMIAKRLAVEKRNSGREVRG